MPVPRRLLVFASSIVCAFLALQVMREPTQVVADERPRAPVSLGEMYEYTAINEVIRANDGRLPKNGTELVTALAKVGDFAQLPVPFSAVALDSGLTRPRVILAPRPGRGLATDEETAPEAGSAPKPAPISTSPISTAKVTQSHLEGRLFLAANLEGSPGEQPRVRTIEFISWNTRKKAFDFGVIDCNSENPEIQILDGVRCIACHKNRGPILGQGPWSNTTHNDVLRVAALQAFLDPKRKVPVKLPEHHPALLGNPTIDDAIRTRTTFDGMSLLHGEPEVCDSAIRNGGNMVRDREIHKLLTKTTDGRKALSLLMAAVATDKPLARADLDTAPSLNRTYVAGFTAFPNQFVAIHKAMSNTLADYSPSGSMGALRTIVTNQPASWGSGSTQSVDIRIVWGSTPDKVIAYDRKRSEGEPGMPSNRLPSNPRSFLRPTPLVPSRPSAAVSVTSLARTIGLTEGDRKFLAQSLAELSSKIGKLKVTAETLAKDVFSAAPFADSLKSGNLPDREEFKDLFADSLVLVAKTHGVEPLKIARGDYASGPSGAAVVAGQEYREPVIVPTTACLRCHDVRGAGKPSAFNPIPPLAFDPFDVKSRDAWSKTVDAKKRAEILVKMVKRLTADKDMPPEDSPEFQKFREQEAASFEAVKDWLDTELSRARGK